MELQLDNELQVLSFIGPVLSVALAVMLAGFWVNHRKSLSTLLFSLACLCFSIAIVPQMLWAQTWAEGFIGIATGTLYVTSFWLLAHGLQSHALVEGRARCACNAIFISSLMGFIWLQEAGHGASFGPYVLDIGSGLILLVAVTAIGALRRSIEINRIIYWASVAFALSFLARMLIVVLQAYFPRLQGNDLALHWAVLYASFVLFITFLSILLMLAIFYEEMKEAKRDRDSDGLTVLLNRRGFFSRGQRLFKSGNDKAAVSLLMLDLDYFKQINDSYGHAVGDSVLVEIGEFIQRTIRATDIAARIGGEEFVILLSGSPAAGARELAERLIGAIAAMQFASLPVAQHLTASVGVATRGPDETLDALLERTDKLLYAAKRSGRNCVVSQELAAPMATTVINPTRSQTAGR